MADLILLCECGLRVNAPNATPGRLGRCPNCGGRLRVPEAPPVPTEGPPILRVAEARPEPPRRPRRKKPAAPLPTATGGLLSPLEHPERGVAGSIIYPLRGAESMGVILVLAVAIWMIGTALPEHCLSLIETASATGRGPLGNLIALITSLPFVIATPFVAFYWLAYLGRVLVSGAKGETSPPRTPDRNFDGFLSAMTPWMIWLFWGFGVGFAPALFIVAFAQPRTPAALWTAAGLAAFGLNYALMALILAHRDGHAAAVTPSSVTIAMLRTSIPFARLYFAIFGLSVTLVAAFLGTVLLRDNYFWSLYMPARFGWCMATAWASIAAMRMLGIFAYHHRAAL